jgi:hypothetical protein
MSRPVNGTVHIHRPKYLITLFLLLGKGIVWGMASTRICLASNDIMRST